MTAPQKTALDAPSARRLAISLLVEVDGGARANIVVPERLGTSGLETRDRAFVTELVYGTVRMRRACDWLVDRFARGKLDAEVRATLRLGAYQLAFLHTPAHAAVSATVAEVKGPARGLVNAVLRRVAETVAGGVRWPNRATELSYPDWIVDLLVADIGEGAALGALAQMNKAAAATVRADGYIQDRASQLVAAHVGARPGERVLDLCAAPGGKATTMAADGACVVAADIEPRRCQLVAANARRLEQVSVAVVAADGANPPWRDEAFDRVLVDAPCSGLGVLRRRPDARWRGRPDDLARLAGLQRRLLEAAAPLVRPGGTLVYSVCTLSRVETAAIDRWAGADGSVLAGWSPLPPPGAPWRPAGRGALLLPQQEGTDGMFVLALRRPGSGALTSGTA